MRRFPISAALVSAAAVAALVTAGVPAGAAGPSFVDPTARLAGDVSLGELVYVGPFATLSAGAGHSIHIGDESDVQDRVTVDASRGDVNVGEMVILAHGAVVVGHAELGESGTCPEGAAHCPSFVSFNAVVDGGNVEKDAMVSALSRVGPGVTIPSGRKTIPGRNVTSAAEVTSETTPVTEADRVFMKGVIHVNVNFAAQYSILAAEDPSNVRGINYDPGNTDFNPERDLPTLDGTSTRDPGFRNRIIGDVHLDDDLDDLPEVMGRRISLRADEGESFEVGSIDRMGNGTVFHALEHSHLHLGDDGRYAANSIVHGGANPFDNTTITGDDFRLGEGSVFFRSRAADDVRIGKRSVVQDSDLAEGTRIPPRVIVVNSVIVATVEW